MHMHIYKLSTFSRSLEANEAQAIKKSAGRSESREPKEFHQQ